MHYLVEYHYYINFLPSYSYVKEQISILYNYSYIEL